MATGAEADGKCSVPRGQIHLAKVDKDGKTRLFLALTTFWLNTNFRRTDEIIFRRRTKTSISPQLLTSKRLTSSSEPRKGHNKNSSVISQEDYCYILLRAGPKLVPREDATNINRCTSGPLRAHLPGHLVPGASLKYSLALVTSVKSWKG